MMPSSAGGACPAIPAPLLNHPVAEILEIPTRRALSQARHDLTDIFVLERPTRNPDTLAFLAPTPTRKRLLRFAVFEGSRHLMDTRAWFERTDTLPTNAQ